MHTARRRDRSPGQLDPANLKSLGLNLFLCSYWNSPVLWVNDVKAQKSCQEEKKETRKKDLMKRLNNAHLQCWNTILETSLGCLIAFNKVTASLTPFLSSSEVFLVSLPTGATQSCSVTLAPRNLVTLRQISTVHVGALRNPPFGHAHNTVGCWRLSLLFLRWPKPQPKIAPLGTARCCAASP